MGEFDEKKLMDASKATSSKEPWTKKVKIVKDNKDQYRVSIPRKFADMIHINEKTDFLEFHLITDEEKEDTYYLQAYLIREAQ